MRFLAYEDGSWQLRENLSTADARTLALGPTPVWIRAEDVPPEEWSHLGEWFDLHPLALEDVASHRHRPKVEAYDDTTFAMVRYPQLTGDWPQLGVFLGAGFVLTASRDAQPILDPLEARMVAGKARVSAHPLAIIDTPAEVFYAVVDATVDAFGPFMDHMEEQLDEVEDEVLLRAERDDLAAIRDVKAMASRARKVVPPMRDAMIQLERGEMPNVTDDVRLFLRDVSDHMMRASERLEHVRESALIAQDTWHATLASQQAETSIQQNRVMQRLTVVAALLLVPGLIAGIGGMNFPGAPEWPFWNVAGTILGAVMIGAFVAWRLRWL